MSVFIDNLQDIFPYKIDKNFMSHNTGTVEWSNAFRETCEQLNIDNLLNYYNSLEWEEFDIFCAELGNLIIEKELVE